MRITLKEPELELEVFKVDTPTGVGWCVILPDERKVLLKFHQGKWQTADNISNQFLQAIGYEIDRSIEDDQPENFRNGTDRRYQTHKRAHILKYFHM